MIANQLRFQHLQEQNPVQPGDDQFEGDIKQPFFMGVAKLGRFLQPGYFIPCFQLHDRIFEERTGVPCLGGFPADQFFTAGFRFGETDDVELFSIK